MHNSQNNSYASNFSRSQSRLKQNNKNIFNQFKNVVNLNGQVEKGFTGYHNITVNQGGNNPRPVFIGAGAVSQSGKGPIPAGNMNLSGFNNPNNLSSLPSKLNSTIGSSKIQNRKVCSKDDDDPPPPISQNHYRHIHEQRDFTMENLSMSGETELEDYDDFKIVLEQQRDLDIEIQDIIMESADVLSDVTSLTKACKIKKETGHDHIKEPPKNIHYRTAEYIPTRRQEIVIKNKVIRHRNKLVRQARENGKFYLEGGVLSQQQSQMFKYDQEVLKTELKTYCEKNAKGPSSQFKQTEATLQSMIAKLDQIQNLNDQAKKNDSFKEKLHQTLRDYLSWKNQIFKQNFIQN